MNACGSQILEYWQGNIKRINIYKCKLATILNSPDLNINIEMQNIYSKRIPPIGVSSCSFNWKNNTYSAFIVLERGIHEYLASDKISWHVRFEMRSLTAVFRIFQFNTMWKKQLGGLMLELVLQSSHWNGMVYLGSILCQQSR